MAGPDDDLLTYHLGSRQLTRYLLQFCAGVLVFYVFAGFTYTQYARAKNWFSNKPGKKD
jgi:hypothetical protein